MSECVCVLDCGIATTIPRHKNVRQTESEREKEEDGGLQILYKLAPVQDTEAR